MSDSVRNTRTPKPSICPFCGVGCSLQFDAERGNATGWRGPVNSRGEVCPKGVAAFDVVDHDERLTTPLVRDDDGDLREATWSEAVSRMETAFNDIVRRHGPDALAFFASSNCTNEENYVLQKLARLLGTNTVDNCARLCHSSTVAAMRERLGAGAMTNSLADIRDETDCLLVVGANPAEQHPIIFRSYLLPAIRRGATLIHVDPRANATTDAADRHLPVRPGYDIPLLNAMARVVVDDELVDEAFLSTRVTGFEAFRAALDDVDVEANAELAGVDAQTVRDAARAYASAECAAIITGMGMSQHHYGTDNVHALLNLALLTGNLGKPGAGVNPLRGQNNVQGAGDVGALPNLLPGYADVTDAEARARVAEVWGVDADALPELPGRTEVEATHAFGESVFGALVFGENPLVTEPNLNRVREQFERLDCLVVLDIFPTETVELADIVLPGSSWAEKAGTVTNTDRQVMRMRPVADTPGDARRDLDVLCELGRRLTEHSEQFEYDSPEAVFEELKRVTPQYAGMSYDGIGTGSQRWPFPAGATAGTAILHVDEFASGSQTAELRSVAHVDPADDVAADELVLTTGRVLQQFNSGAITRRSGMLMRLRGTDVLQIHPDDANSREIDDGDTVVVSNDRGEVIVEAEVTPAIRPGTVFATFHYATPLLNVLTGDTLDPVAKIPEYKHTAVRLSRTRS